jgi:hypothetical protein
VVWTSSVAYESSFLHSIPSQQPLSYLAIPGHSWKSKETGKLDVICRVQRFPNTSKGEPMINNGLCPNTACGKRLSNVSVEDIDISHGFSRTWRGVSYVCPHCKTILGIGIDPVALKTDTINGVVKALRGK